MPSRKIVILVPIYMVFGRKRYFQAKRLRFMPYLSMQYAPQSLGSFMDSIQTYPPKHSAGREGMPIIVNMQPKRGRCQA